MNTADRDKQRARRRTKGPVLFRHKGNNQLYIKVGPAYNKGAGCEGHRMMVYTDLEGIRYVRYEKEWEEKFEPVTNTASL